MKQETLEEAASAYRKSIACMDAQYGAPHRDRMITSQTTIGAFKAGAEWQRNSVWHNNSVTPDRNLEGGSGELVIVEQDNGKFSVGNVRFTGVHYYIACDSYWVNMERIKRWAYISDLLPEGGEE